MALAIPRLPHAVLPSSAGSSGGSSREGGELGDRLGDGLVAIGAVHLVEVPRHAQLVLRRSRHGRASDKRQKLAILVDCEHLRLRRAFAGTCRRCPASPAARYMLSGSCPRVDGSTPGTSATSWRLSSSVPRPGSNPNGCADGRLLRSGGAGQSPRAGPGHFSTKRFRAVQAGAEVVDNHRYSAPSPSSSDTLGAKLRSLRASVVSAKVSRMSPF